MLPNTDGDGHSLAAFVNCFANGPSSLRRLNMKLRDIHSEVPGYDNHLSVRMDKWFENLKAGVVVMRSNVSSPLTSLRLIMAKSYHSGL